MERRAAAIFKKWPPTGDVGGNEVLPPDAFFHGPAICFFFAFRCWCEQVAESVVTAFVEREKRLEPVRQATHDVGVDFYHGSAAHEFGAADIA